MNADIFNAYQDFTLNGVSIVNRIATNEGDIALLNSEVITLQSEIDTNETDIATNTSDIATNTSDILDLETDKQDVLTFDSTPTAGSNNPVSSQGIKSYVDSSTPTITANLPLDYSSATGVIRGIFDSVPTNSSINFLNSNVIYDALQLKQDEITSSTNLTTGNIGVVGNLTAQGGVSGASLFSTGLVSGANLQSSALVSGVSLQLNNSAGNQITCAGTGLSVFSGISCADINSAGSISTTSGQIGTTSGSISTSSGDIITSTGDITAPSGTISAGTISTTGAGGTITSANIIQGTTNLLNEINTKQDILTFDTTPTAGSNNPVSSQGIKTYVDGSTPSITATAPIIYSGGVISGTFDATPTNGSINFLSSDKVFDALALKQDLITSTTSLTTADITANGNITASSLSTTGSLLMTGGSSQISNAGAYNGTGNILTSGNIIGTDFITNSGTNILTKINTKQDLITSSTALTCGSVSTTAITGNPVINSGAITCNANITTSSNITCGGDLSAIGSGNNIDLRNNLVAGAGVSLTQTGNNTTINNTATGTSQLYYFKATSNQNGDQAFSSANVIANFNQILYNVPSGYDIGNKRYVVPVAGTYQFFFQAFQNSASTGAFRLGIFQNNNLMGMTGASVANTERCGVIIECAVGDGIDVRRVSGSGNVYMSNLHSWFEGYLLAGSSQLSTSTQYYFKANGTANQSLATGITNELVNFNNVLFQSPSGYNITNKEYEVQVAGVYQFFYQIFFAFNNANAEVRLGLYLTRGGTTTTINQTGQYIYTAERLGLTYECLVGDKFSVRVVYNNSGGTISTILGQSWFEGYLLQPENNTITDTTNLTTNSLTTLTGNIISGGDIETSSGNFLVSNSGDVECGDLQAENLIINTNLNSETFIRTIAIGKIESNGANTKVVNCSVNRTNVGRYTFTFTNPRPTANYVINITITENAVILDDIIVQVVNGTQTANGFNYFIHEQDNGGTAGTYRDRASFISVFDTD